MSSRRLLQTLSIALALATTTLAASPALAQTTPDISGTLRTPDTNAAWGSFEVFSVTSNAFGFFLRFRPSNGHVMTVTPFETQPDGQIACWYIEYLLIGATDPARTEGWQWQEVAGGRVLLNPATVTGSSIDGTMAQTYQMVGYTRVDEQSPRFAPIRLSIP